MTMANSPRENLAQWLRDAHAMEVGTLDDLRRLAGRVESYPQLKARLEQHVRESEGQERRLKELLEGMGEGTSAVKETVTRLAGNVQALVGALFTDETLKNAISAYAFEHFEIGNYRALLAAAEQAGEARAVAVLQENLREEEAMARWLEERLPELTRRYLELDASGQGGKT
jgi:ferritin-like metal-binding protein YciE